MAQAKHKAIHRAAKRRPSTLAKVGALLAAPVPDVELLIGAMANPDSGIKFVLGIAKQAGRRVSEVQSVIFDKLKWTADAAKGWLRDHGFSGTAKDEGATFWRFRQESPGKYREFRTVVPGMRRNPTPSDSISSYQEHLETTTDPEFRSATPGEQAAAMTAQDLCENPSIKATVLDYNYDAPTNKTWAKVETPEFTEWFWISGRVSRADVLGWLMPTIQRKLAEFGPAGNPTIPRYIVYALPGNTSDVGILQKLRETRPAFKSEDYGEATDEAMRLKRERGMKVWLRDTQEDRFKGQYPPLNLGSLDDLQRNPYGSKSWEQLGYHLGHTRGGQDRAAIDVNLHVSTDPGDIRRQAEWHIDNQLKLQPGYRESFRPHIVSAFVNGWHDGYTRRKPRMKKPNPAYGQVKGRGWTQEWYETAAGDARKRAAQLRKLGYWVGVSKGTPQVTGVGVVNMTLVSIGPGTTGDEYLENVPEPAGGIVRMNPTYKGAVIHKTPFGKWKLQLGGMEHSFKTKKQATAFVDRMERTGELNRNPESTAAELYEQFHGKPPGETLEIVTEKHEHEWLTQLGVLVELKVATLTNLEATIRFDKDAPQLCSSEDGRQLYIEGGDQSIDLKDLKMDGDKWRKDSMALGVLVECTYQTEKGFQNFQLTDYYHHLGEETGVQPFLLYDPNSQLLSVAGGQYEVKPEGIIN